jgi:hypothetical protein
MRGEGGGWVTSTLTEGGRSPARVKISLPIFGLRMSVT